LRNFHGVVIEMQKTFTVDPSVPVLATILQDTTKYRFLAVLVIYENLIYPIFQNVKVGPDHNARRHANSNNKHISRLSG